MMVATAVAAAVGYNELIRGLASVRLLTEALEGWRHLLASPVGPAQAASPRHRRHPANRSTEPTSSAKSIHPWSPPPATYWKAPA